MRLVRARQKILRELLKQARLSANLRQVDVAASISKPQSHIAKIESGERKMDFIEVLDICAAVNPDPCDLVNKLSK